MRYAPKTAMDPILGKHVTVQDLRLKRIVTLFTGLEAWERAEARCAELNEKEAYESTASARAPRARGPALVSGRLRHGPEGRARG